MDKKYTSLFMCLLLAATLWGRPAEDNNHTVNINGQTVGGNEEVVGGHGEQNAIGNTVNITGSTVENNNSPLHNSQITGGWAVDNAANGNTVNVTDSTVNRNIFGGVSTFGSQANNNTVSVTGSSVSKDAPLHEVTNLSQYQAEHRYDDQGNDIYVLTSSAQESIKVSGDLTPESSNYTIYGGNVAKGEAAGNRVIVRNSDGNIGNNLVGAYTPYLAGTRLHDNRVEVYNSRVSGLITGAASVGANWDVNIKNPLVNSYNSVFIGSSSVNDAIGAYGGLSTHGNSVVLSDSSADSLYGVSFGQNIFYYGRRPAAIENTAYNNSVRLENNSSASGNVYGAQSHSVQARGNRVEVTDGSSVQGNIYGAHIVNARVQMDENTVVWNTVQTAAENNSVLLQNARVGQAGSQIAGAQNFSGWADLNHVEIAASTVTASSLAGGWAEHERQPLTEEGQHDFALGYRAEGNTVTASESRIAADVYGGLVTREEAVNPNGEEDLTQSSSSANFVQMQTSSVSGNVYGGAARGDHTRAESNRVWLSDMNISGNVYGALAEGADSYAARNDVVLHNTSVNGDVYGSSAARGENNTVTLSGRTDITGTVHGGAEGGNQLTLLNFQSRQALKLTGFDKPYLIYGADTSVTFSQDVKEAHVVIRGIADVDGHVLARTPNAGSSFILHSEDSGVYTYFLTPNDRGAWTEWLLSGGFSRQRAESYAQTALVALSLANAGDGLLDGVLREAAHNEREKGTFLQTGYENVKHHTGSGFRLRAATALAGLYGKNGDWTGGFYARYAYGDYNTYPTPSESYASSWSGGLFGAWDAAENLRLSADMRLGWQNTSYGGSSETGSTFEYEGLFSSIQTGAEYGFWDVLSVGARLRWTHIRGDTMTDNLGETVYLSGSDSLLGTLGLSYKPQALVFGRFTPQAKAELLHEFNGNAATRVEGRRLDRISLRGTSVRATLGLVYDNKERGLTVALAGFAQGGQQDGWGAELNAALRF